MVIEFSYQNVMDSEEGIQRFKLRREIIIIILIRKKKATSKIALKREKRAQKVLNIMEFSFPFSKIYVY